MVHLLACFLSADAYIIQIQKYEVLPAVTSVSVISNAASKTTPAISLMNSSQIRLTSASSAQSVLMPGQSTTSSLTFPKVLGLADSAVRPKLKMSISQATAAVKSTASVTNQKTLAHIPIQLGGQIKNQHITLAALNQLTAGKLSGAQVGTTGGKTVKIISPAKPGQHIRPHLNMSQKLGLNNPILSPVVSSSVALQQSLKLPVCGTATTTTSAATQYALVRAQVPGSGGAPPQTLTFIRAISPNSSSTSSGTTVTVTPQQMAALLKGQQGQTQIQKVLSAASGGSPIRTSLTVNANTNLKAGSVQVTPSKIVSVQFPTKMAGNNPLKAVSMSSLLGTKILTTQSTNISPMATLVSGAGSKPSSTSLVNQFPAVRPQLPSGLAALSVLAASSKPHVPSVTTQESIINTGINSTAVSNLTVPPMSVPLSAVNMLVNPDIASLTSNITNPPIQMNPELLPERASRLTGTKTENVTLGIHLAEVKDSIDADNHNIMAGLSNSQADLKPNLPFENTIQENNNIKFAMKEETKMEVDQVKIDLGQNTENQNSEFSKKNENDEDDKTELKQELIHSASVESAAATTLAQLASLAGSTTNIPNTIINTDSTAFAADMSQNPLSTLAALASSSPIATGPIENNPHNGGSPVKPLNGGFTESGKKVKFVMLFVFSFLSVDLCFSFSQ